MHFFSPVSDTRLWVRRLFFDKYLSFSFEFRAYVRVRKFL